MKTEAIEITSFSLSKGLTIDDFITANADVDIWLAKQPGFILRRISQRKDGTVIDMLLWDTTEDAEKAARGIVTELANSPVHAAIDQSTVDWSVSVCRHSVN